MAEQAKSGGGRSRPRRKQYSKAFGQRICERIATCGDWRESYEGFGKPPYDALHVWPETHPEFAAALARAREIAADARADAVLAIAEQSTAATVAVDRLKIMTVQWHVQRTSPPRPAARPDGQKGAMGGDGQIRIREFVPVDGEDGRPFTREIRLDGSCVDFDG
ncbi:MAG: hypothetical protein AB1942_12860 [Pseudomonadota bacterium]